MLFRLRPNPVLVALILDRLPTEVWTSTSTTFIDPAMGSGQFVTEIERRLRAHGHSDDSIRSRVFGLESNQMDVNIAVNMNGLVGTYRKDANYSAFLNGELKRLLGKDCPMHFDVVAGNMPYQNGGDAGNFALWPEFCKAAGQRWVKPDGGFVTFVMPQTWAGNEKVPEPGAKSVSKVRSELMSMGHLIYADFTTGQYFPGIGSTFSHFLLKMGTTGPSEITTEHGACTVDYAQLPWLPINACEKTISILMKTVWSDRFQKLSLFNSGKETTGFRNGASTIRTSKSEKFPWRIANTSAQYSKGQFVYSSVEHPAQRLKKVIFSDSGYSSPFYDNGECGIGHHARAIVVSSKKEAAKKIALLKSALFEFAGQTKATSGSASKLSLIMKYLPDIDGENDDDFFQAAQLTSEEIEHVLNYHGKRTTKN